MPRARAFPLHTPRALTPVIVAIGPLICAVTLTTLAFFMFQAQAGASRRGQLSAQFSPLEYTVILALAGALVALLMASLGLALHNRARKAQEMRGEALNEGLSRLGRIDDLARRIEQRGEWREEAANAWMRRQRRALESTAAMAGPRANLQRVASDIWAGMSQPGAPLTPAMAMRLARESAVAGAALGAAVDDLYAQLTASTVELDEMKSAGDTIFADLNAIEEVTRHTRLMFSLAAGAESEALTKVLPAQRPQQSAKGTGRLGMTGKAPAVNAGGMAPAGQSGAPDGARMAPADWQTGRFPVARDDRQAWPNSGSFPAIDRGESGQRQHPAGQSGQWPRRPGGGPEQRGGESGPQRPDPRRRDDNSSKWLND
jgi:hypothetical protein